MTEPLKHLETTRGERATLDRALRFYAAHYQQLASKEPHAGSKRDLLNYVEAAGRLLDRLRAVDGLPTSGVTP